VIEPMVFGHVSFHSMEPGHAAGVHVRELVAALRRRGIRCVAINREGSGRSRLRGYVSVLWRALRSLRHVDVLYIRSHPVSFVLVAIARCGRSGSTVIEVNGTAADLSDAYGWARAAERIIAVFDRLSLRWTDAIVTVSGGLRDWAREQAPAVPIAVIPNAADPRRFHPDVARRPGLPSRYVAYCGALARWQGLDTLIEATRDPCWPSGVRLVVAGDGPLRRRSMISGSSTTMRFRASWLEHWRSSAHGRVGTRAL
jgi:glycosyltransferase involved in cell wall biosynthesis